MQKIRKNHEKYLDNPLNAFKLIKRNSVDLKFFEFFFPDIKSLFKDEPIEFPSENDLAGAISGLLRLQKVYKLKSADLANGILNGRMTGVKLTTHDLFVIGKNALQHLDENYFAEDYLELAMERLMTSDAKYSGANFLEISESLFELYLRKFDLKKANLVLISLDFATRMQLKGKFTDAYNRARSLKSYDFEDPYNEEFERNGLYGFEKEMTIFSQVCRGVLTRSYKETSQLYCKFHSTNFFTRLAPFKAEILSLDPQILILYNVTSDEDGLTLKRMLRQVETSTAKIIHENGTEIATDQVRVAELGWFYEDDDKIFPKLTRRLEVSYEIYVKLCKILS